MTQWSPDTCDCVINYDSDVVYVSSVRACTKHAAHLGLASHLDTVLAHNRKKNAILNSLLGLGADPGGTFVGYDADDNLVIRNSNLSEANRAAFLTKAATAGLDVASIRLIS